MGLGAMGMSNGTNLSAVILAGGRGRRMNGQDKGLIPFKGKPLVQQVIDMASPYVSAVVVNANRNGQEYARLGYPVISDDLDGFQGPLAGFLAGLRHIETENALFLPCDTPLLRPLLIERLLLERTAQGAEIAVAHDGHRLQSVCAIVPKCLETSLKNFLEQGERKIDRWYGLHQVAVVDFSDQAEMFVNINTPDDLVALADD